MMGKSIFQTMMPQSDTVTNFSPFPQFANPIQKAQYILATLTNPAAFVKQQFPDVPDEIASNPQAILAYLQKTRGITPEQIQQIQNHYPYGGGK